MQRVQQGLGKGLAGREHDIHAAHGLAERGLLQIGEQAGGRAVQNVGAVLRYVLRERIRIVHPLLVREYDGYAVEQGGEQLEHGNIKADRADRHDAFAVRADIAVEFIVVRLHEVDDAAVLDHDALGLAGRTRGIDDIAQPVLADRGQRCVRLLRRVKQRAGRNNRTAGARDVRLRDQQAGLTVRQDKADAFFGIGAVDRHIGRARLENTQQHHGQRSGARQQERHIGLRLHTGGDQVARDTVRGLVQLAEGVAGAFAGQGAPVRMKRRLRAEAGDDGIVRVNRQHWTGEQRALAAFVLVGQQFDGAAGQGAVPHALIENGAQHLRDLCDLMRCVIRGAVVEPELVIAHAAPVKDVQGEQVGHSAAEVHRAPHGKPVQRQGKVLVG